MDYKIGDKVVYPNHGVGIIEQINFGVMNGRTEKYYMLKIYSSGLKVMVPASNAISVGLRPVIRNGETLKVLGFLEKGKPNSHHDWKHRFKENSRASQIPPRQRTRYRAKHLRRNNGRCPDQITRESATADAFATGKTRRCRVLDFEFRS